MTPAQVFGQIYREKKWGEGSGGGSDPAVCAPYCRWVERFIRILRPDRVLDIGCGDGRVMRAIDWQGVSYFGIDCAYSPVLEPDEEYSFGSASFTVQDALTFPLPTAYLVLLKEVLQHLPNADVIRLMERIKNYPYVIHCSGYDGVVNADIAMGETRPVDLALPPFNLPAKTVLTYGGGYKVQLLER